MGLNVTWTSRRGRAREDNRDAGGLLHSGPITFAVILDASNRGPKGAEFGRQWIKHVLDAVAAVAGTDPTIVLSAMRDAHSLLRSSYPCEVASYSALLLRHDLHKAWAIACGDCRIGSKREPDGTIEWLTPVHTLANKTGEPFTTEHALSPERHTLTRSLNARRFACPDIIELDINAIQCWLLATDGYWIEHLIAKVAQEKLNDDASCLQLRVAMSDSYVDSDCDNWYVLSRLRSTAGEALQTDLISPAGPVVHHKLPDPGFPT
jgi:serine/threonine protein phosphatase PrpC